MRMRDEFSRVIIDTSHQHQQRSSSGSSNNNETQVNNPLILCLCVYACMYAFMYMSINACACGSVGANVYEDICIDAQTNTNAKRFWNFSPYFNLYR